MVFVINGRIYNLAAQTEMDISGQTRLVKDAAAEFSDESWSDAAAAGGFTAIGDDEHCRYVWVVNSAGTIRVIEGTKVAITETLEWPDMPADGTWVPFAGLEVKNETGSSFTLGTTALDTANVTDTYYDLAYLPGQ